MARIFVVDDQASVRNAIRRILEAAGHDVVEAGNGKEAVENLAGAFDLVITDILMPEMDEIEFIRHLKRMRRDVPVLVVSGGWKERGVDLLSVAKKLGADRTLSKAKIMTDLLPAVAALLPGPLTFSFQ